MIRGSAACINGSNASPGPRRMHDSRQYVFIKRSCPFPIHADGDVKGQKVPGYTMGDCWLSATEPLYLPKQVNGVPVFWVFPGPLLHPVVAGIAEDGGNLSGLSGTAPICPIRPPPALPSLPFLLLSSPGGPDGSHRTHALALLQVKRPSDALWFPWQRRSSRAALAFAERERGSDQSAIDRVCNSYSKQFPFFHSGGG